MNARRARRERGTGARFETEHPRALERLIPHGDEEAIVD